MSSRGIGKDIFVFRPPLSTAYLKLIRGFYKTLLRTNDKKLRLRINLQTRFGWP